MASTGLAGTEARRPRRPLFVTARLPTAKYARKGVSPREAGTGMPGTVERYPLSPPRNCFGPSIAERRADLADYRSLGGSPGRDLADWGRVFWSLKNGRSHPTLQPRHLSGASRAGLSRRQCGNARERASALPSGGSRVARFGRKDRAIREYAGGRTRPNTGRSKACSRLTPDVKR
jgi:hypothetical protein